MRRILFWIHLSIGVVISLLVIFFSVTGALIAYERQILNSADRHSFSVETHSGEARMPLAALIAKTPGTADTITIYSEPQHPVEVLTKKRDLYLVDPYSGVLSGPASPRLRAFFAKVTALHRWFGLGNTSHQTTTVVKGAAVLLFLVVLVTGPVLWLPKRCTRMAITGGILPRFDVQGRARNYNWHKVTGFWIGLPLTVILVTGIIMAYPWANAALFRLAGSPVPQRAGADSGGRVRGRAPDSDASTFPDHLDEAFAQATNGIGDWQSASLRLQSGKILAFSIDRSEGGHPEKHEQIAVDAKSLQVVRREPFAAMTRGQQWRAWVRFTHTGEAGGWWGEGLALISASGAVVLAITGLGLSYDRLRRWQR